jgi:hypothetical protein
MPKETNQVYPPGYDQVKEMLDFIDGKTRGVVKIGKP